jgi:hypothetical protein
MKKRNFIFALSTAAVLLTALPFGSFSAFAADESESESESVTDTDDSDVIESGDYAYSFNTEDDDYYSEDTFVKGSIRIEGYRGTDKELVIPSEIDGYTVTTLANYSLNYLSATSITIPATITKIGESCFFEDTMVTEYIVEDGNEFFTTRDGVLFNSDSSVIYAYPTARTDSSYIIPPSVIEIAPACFSYSLLTDVTFSSSLVYIDSWAFTYGKLQSLTVPSTVTAIDMYAFAYCEDLSSVQFESGSALESIGSAAFAMCSEIRSITLPTSLSEIGQTAFLGTGLTSIRIPSSVSSIGYNAFGYDEDFNAISSFTIYGAEGSQGQSYATEVDEENSYENNFTFIADSDSSSDTEETKKSTISYIFIAVVAIVSLILIAVIALIVVLVLKKVSADSDKKGKKK